MSEQAEGSGFGVKRNYDAIIDGRPVQLLKITHGDDFEAAMLWDLKRDKGISGPDDQAAIENWREARAKGEW